MTGSDTGNTGKTATIRIVLDAALASARAIVTAREADMAELAQHIDKLKGSANPLRDAPLQKLVQRQAALEREAADAKGLVTQVEALAGFVRAFEAERTRLKTALAEAGMKQVAAADAAATTQNALAAAEANAAKLKTALADVEATAAKLRSSLTDAEAAAHQHETAAKDAAAEAATKADEKIRELRTLTMRREQELTEAGVAKDREIEKLKAGVAEENKILAAELHAARAEVARVEQNAMTALAERRSENQKLREKAVAAINEAATLRAEAASLKELVEMLSGTDPPHPASTPPQSASAQPAAAPAAVPAPLPGPTPARGMAQAAEAALPPLPPGLPPPPPLASGAKGSEPAKDGDDAVALPGSLSAPPTDKAPPTPPRGVPAPPSSSAAAAAAALANAAASASGPSAAASAGLSAGAASAFAPAASPPAEAPAPPPIPAAVAADTRVRALPLLSGATFTHEADQKLAAAILPAPTSIGELARTMNVDVAIVSESISDFVELGLIELV